LATAGRDGKVRIWDVASGKVLAEYEEEKTNLRKFSSSVNSVAFSHDGEKLAAKFDSKTVLIWSLKSNKQLINIKIPFLHRTGLTFSPGGTWLTDGHFVWDSNSGTRIYRFPISEAAISFGPPNGKLLAIGTYGGKIYILNFSLDKEEKNVMQIGEHTAKPVLSVAFNPNGRLLASVGKDGTIHFWGVVKDE
jgi:WD40 repeat protein